MNTSEHRLSAVVIGAGFSGLGALHHLKNVLGLDARILEKTDGIGGTWHTNRFPGALSDSQGYLYRFSFDEVLLQESDLSTKYVDQSQVHEYLSKFARRHELSDHIQLNTTVTSARFDDDRAMWCVETDQGDTIECTYLILGTGSLNAAIAPDIPGLDCFDGDIFFTSSWPRGASLTGKRVGVVGTGSTGTQVVTASVNDVQSLVVFQRTAQYCVPLRNRPLSEEETRAIKSSYRHRWHDIMNSDLAFGFVESQIPAMSVSAEERDAIFERAWNEGGGFNFMFGTFGDITTHEEANQAAASFIKKKIREIVKDGEVADRLTPTDTFWARRPLADGGYYEVFNRAHVTLEDVKANPIVNIRGTTVEMADGSTHDLDVIVLATGFDAFEGSFIKIDVQGVDGRVLRDQWKELPKCFMGVSVPGFPNMFTLNGPTSAFSNNPSVIESQLEYITELIRFHRTHALGTMCVSDEATDTWYQHSDDLMQGTLFPRVPSWIFGHNVPGKSTATRAYPGGLKEFRRLLAAEAESGYRSYEIS